jgi:hypothetical protein
MDETEAGHTDVCLQLRGKRAVIFRWPPFVVIVS